MPYISGVLSLLALALWVYCLVDSATTPSGQARYLNKWLWFAIVAVFSVVGAIAWIALGRPRRVPADVTGAGGAGAEIVAEPEPEKPRRRPRPTVSAPDDDPEFLKRLEEITELEKQAREEEGRDGGSTGEGRDDRPEPA